MNNRLILGESDEVPEIVEEYVHDILSLRDHDGVGPLGLLVGG